MTIIEQYTTVTDRARNASETSLEIFKQGAQAFSEQAATFTTFPRMDLATVIEGYFGLIQRAMAASRDVAAIWIDVMNSLSGVAREQAQTVGTIVLDRTYNVADLATKQAEKALERTEKAAEKAAEEAEKVADAQEHAEALQAEQAAREQTKRAHDKAREPYQDLTKAELSELLVKRELPKSGNLGDLIERLVEADSK
jgi:hypothetical protein